MKNWRPMMAVQYWFICMFDFIVFPILNAIYFADTSQKFIEWHPLTLQAGGLYHLSMGAIIGVTSWQRSQEKMAIMRSDAGSYTESSRTTETVTSKDAGNITPDASTTKSSRAD